MRRILVVDDDAAVRSAIKLLLETYGFEVVLAGNGRQGIKAVESSDLDLVLLDVFMPGMDGLETIKALHEVRPGLPIIAMSGALMRDSSAPDYLSFATKLGAIAALPKPFRPDDLLDAVKRTIGETGGSGGLSGPS